MTEVDVFLEHYGVKGMRWGHRKASRSNPVAGKNKTSGRISSRLDTGGNVVNSIVYSPLGAAVIARRSKSYGRGGSSADRKAGKEQKRSERLTTRLDTGNHAVNAVLRSPAGTVIIALRTQQEHKRLNVNIL